MIETATIFNDSNNPRAVSNDDAINNEAVENNSESNDESNIGKNYSLSLINTFDHTNNELKNQCNHGKIKQDEEVISGQQTLLNA